MNKLVKFSVLSLLLISLFLLATPLILAQEITRSATRLPIRTITRSITRGPVQCDVTKARFDKLLLDYDRKHKRHLDSYNRIKDYGQKFVNKLKEHGYDTTQLEADLETLTTTYLNKLSTDYNTFITELRRVRDEVCTYSSPDQLKSAIDKLKSLLAVVRQDIVDTKNFWHTTIQADIKTIRDLRPEITRVRPTGYTTIRPTRPFRIIPTYIVRPTQVIE